MVTKHTPFSLPDGLNSHPGDSGAKVITEILGYYFGLRYNKNLRGKGLNGLLVSGAATRVSREKQRP